MEEKIYGQNWYLGETLPQVLVKDTFKYTVTTMFMTAQIANGGFEIKPRIIVDGKKMT